MSNRLLQAVLLTAYCMILHGLLLSADFFNQLFREKKTFMNITRVSKTFWIQIRPDVMIWVQTVFKSNQQMTLLGKELTIHVGT